MTVNDDKRISFPILLAFAFWANLLSMPILFAHMSTGATVLGRYSTRYAVVLFAAVLLIVFWLGTWFYRSKIEVLNQKIPALARYFLIVLITLVSLGVTFLPFEPHILAFACANGIFLIILLAYPLTDGWKHVRIWYIAIFVSCVVFIVLVLITNLTQRPLHPDDAHWADASTTVWLRGGLYTRTWHEEPIKIVPGVGWVSGLYGWILLNVDFDLRVGRLIRFSSNMLITVGMGVLMGKLYGRRVAFLTTLIALTSFFIVGDGSYRPNMMVTSANFFLMALLLKARESSGYQAYILHFLVGLGVTLSMELHALALGLALGVSIFYVGDFVWQGRKGNWSYWQMLVAYGAGALIGTLIYYFANIAVVGGLDIYLQKLVGERYVPTRSFRWLNPPIFERILILAGWSYLLWRRSDKDKLFVALFGCIFISTVLIDTSGYLPNMMALLLLPAAIPFVEGFEAGRYLPRRFVVMVSSMLLIMMIWLGQVSFAWMPIRHFFATGALERPEIYDIGEAIVPYVRHDEVIVTTHELIWTFYDYPNLTSFAAEAQLQRYDDYDEPDLVWDEIQADVIVDLPRRAVTPPGLAQYRAENFTECHRLFARANVIVIYRQDCDDSPVQD